jgi:hypothetical protein
MIQWFIQAGRIVGELAHRLGTWSGRCIRLAVAIVLLWPVAIILCAILPWGLEMVITPFVAVAPLVVIAIATVLFANPLTFAALTALYFTPVGKRFFGGIGMIIGGELAIGVFVAVFPLWRAPRLIPLLVLVALTLAFLTLETRMREAQELPAKNSKWLQKSLVGLMIAITAFVVLIGTLSYLVRAGNVVAAQLDKIQQERQEKERERAKKAEAEKPVVIEQPLAPARPNPKTESLSGRDDSTGTSENEDVQSIIPTAVDPNAAPEQVGTNAGDINIVVQHCIHRVEKATRCEVMVESDADDPQEFAFKESGTATDNKGNTVPILLGQITSDVGPKVTLRKGIWSKFTIVFKDESFGTSDRARIIFHVRQDGVYGDIDMLNSVRIS